MIVKHSSLAFQDYEFLLTVHRNNSTYFNSVNENTVI